MGHPGAAHWSRALPDGSSRMLADVQSRRIALAQIAPRLGSLEVNLATHHDLLAKAREGFAYQIAEVYAVRGEKDKAFEWLQIALDNHDTGMLTLLVDPLLRGLRDDPRYKAVLEKVGLPGSL